jgi:hypothetical protein
MVTAKPMTPAINTIIALKRSATKMIPIGAGQLPTAVT